MIKIICIGKIKEKYLIDALEDYKKRLSKYTKLEIIELKDEPGEKCLLLEKESIKKNIKSTDNIIVLDINGKEYNSLDFASLMEKELSMNSNITFVIGSSTGLDEEIKNLANKSISFSKLTFPHGLFRLILLEQIYRGFKILNNETYHK